MQMTLPQPLLLQLSEQLANQMGLYYPVNRWGDLERGLNAAVPALGMKNVETCVRHILSASLARPQIEVLARHLTVGETYFFREKRVLHVLEERIFPELIRACVRAHRTLRIWSAGCCTGEEAYSIAIILDRLIHPSEECNTVILATDINPAFLQKATDGIYSDWSFRDTPGWIKERYFKKKKNGQFEILPHIRKRVSFSYLNLAEDTYPSAANRTDAMDMVFCRNVMMYFSAEARRKIVRNFHRSLVDGGWLIVSAVEVQNSAFPQFHTRSFPLATLYQKGEISASLTGMPACEISAPTPLFPPPNTYGMPEAHPVRLHKETAKKEPAVREASSPGSKDRMPDAQVHTDRDSQQKSESHHRTAREHANLGQLGEAIKWCEKAIAADKLNGPNHYLMATLQLEAGQERNAIQSLLRILYLDPDFVLAHFALANLHLSRGRKREAGRHFDNTLSLLHRLPPDAPLPESEGLTAGQLIEIIHSLGYPSSPNHGSTNGSIDRRGRREEKTR
ncbi:MAG TPA: CheR family methyltransferase [Nitrosospira sp.]|nr:CheR family methyltransferase [Nitrosospira sp.]